MQRLPAERSGRPQLVRAVLVPFVLTRALLLVTAWFSERFEPSWTYPFPTGSVRGWVRVPSLALDAWGRYDTYWYLDLAAHGYRAPASLAQQSNLAFFPLYPWLVRGAHALLPASWQGDAARYLVALALANLFAVAGVALVYLVLRESLGDEAAARRSTLYLLLFPASFFLSCAYTESLFLLLSAAALLLALRGRWGLLIPVGFALGLSRPTGVLFGAPLLLAALREAPGGPREPPPRVRQALAVLAPAAGFAAHAVHLALLTGAPAAVLEVQAAWGRALSAPWTTLFAPRGVNPGMLPFELAAVLLVLALSIALFALDHPVLAVAALASVVPVLLSGTLMSATRLVAVGFPAFAPLGLAGRRHGVDRAVTLTFTVGQVLLFLAWTRFYWVA